MAKKKYGLAKRFGARYGASIKLRLAKIETEQRKRQQCPYCGEQKVRRVALGIWYCSKCKAKFTGKAYAIQRAKGRQVTREAGDKVESVEAGDVGV
jgi:large subunit ribosomal protein L37Ae